MDKQDKPEVYLWTVKITTPSGGAWYEDRMLGKNGSMVLLRGYPEEHVVVPNVPNGTFWCFRSVRDEMNGLPHYKLDWEHAIMVRGEISAPQLQPA